jgi:adhesin transport system outer membrane protein
MRLRSKLTVLALSLLVHAQTLHAQPAGAAADPLRLAVEKALQSNPELAAKFNAYLGAANAVDVVNGALRPRVDVDASVGVDENRISSRGPEAQSLRRTGLGLSLTQLLWDGLGSIRDVERASHDRLSRYFDLLEATEQTSLEATRAFYDVLRFRKMVELAEDNYVQHRYASQQIQARFRAGVGRGVDFEQANARLSLAESNLTTETANLHDVMARYLRVIGEVPPRELGPLTVFTTGLPGSSREALELAVIQSPAISATVESVRAARLTSQVREAAYQPKVEARVRSGFGNNFNGIRDQRRDSSAEVVLNWNLYNGGTDSARVRQQANLLSQTEDLRDKTCRDVRQTAAIAFNDTRRLTEQLVLLDRNTLAIEKARDAYRQQFDIGQRSLLDLLNSENELYTARRSYSNAEYDRALAFARAHAGLSQLTAQLGISNPVSLNDESRGWALGGDAPRRCPGDAITLPVIDLEELASRMPPPPEPVQSVLPTQPTPEAQLSELDAKKTDRGMVITLSDVLFESGKADLVGEGPANLAKIADFFRRNPQRSASIEGHTDSVGSATMNQGLSERRANSVKTALVYRGVPTDRLTIRAHGKNLPVATNSTAAGRQMNRRVEIVFAP